MYWLVTHLGCWTSAQTYVVACVYFLLHQSWSSPSLDRSVLLSLSYSLLPSSSLPVSIFLCLSPSSSLPESIFLASLLVSILLCLSSSLLSLLCLSPYLLHPPWISLLPKFFLASLPPFPLPTILLAIRLSPLILLPLCRSPSGRCEQRRDCIRWGQKQEAHTSLHGDLRRIPGTRMCVTCMHMFVTDVHVYNNEMHTTLPHANANRVILTVIINFKKWYVHTCILIMCHIWKRIN